MLSVLLIMTAPFAREAEARKSGVPSDARHQAAASVMTGDSVRWRMPPMDTKMPPLPGLSGAVPDAEPFLPGATFPFADLPVAASPETLRLQDGDSLTLAATPLAHSVGSIRFTGYGYNGSIPGPVIHARQGSTVHVTFRNELDTPNTVHWHGLRIDNIFDGTPVLTQDPVSGGDLFTYTLRLEDPGVYWYHPGVRTDVHVDAGLYGALVVEPTEPEPVVAAVREQILFLDDMLLDAAGPFPWGKDVPNHALMGRFGNRLLVNGRMNAELRMTTDETIRVILINAANSRTFNLVFGGLAVTLRGSGSGALPRPLRVDNVLIAPGERYVVDVRADRPGTYQILNAVQAIDHFRGEFYPDVREMLIVRAAATDEAGTGAGTDTTSPTETAVRTKNAAGDETAVHGGSVRGTVVTDHPSLGPPVGLRLTEHLTREPDRRLDLTLRAYGLPRPIIRMMEIDTLYVPPIEFNDAMPMMNWLSTGSDVVWVLRDADTGRENMEIYWDFDVGDLIKIRVHNREDSLHPMHHPLHIRGQRMLVLATDGVANAYPVWKDTALIPVASTVDLLVEMSNPGEWVMHCHIFEHLHTGMMLSYGVWDAIE